MLRALALMICLIGASPAWAQTQPTEQVRSQILVVETEKLFTQTMFGQRLSRAYQDASEALLVENQRILSELTQEESALTALRETLSPDEFEIKAEAFDQKVQAIRIAQDAKERALPQIITEGRVALLEAATPILANIMLESGAAVILDKRNVMINFEAVDITARAIALIDASIGDGLSAPNPTDN